ncbi:MAG: hypothetical protein ACH0QD_05390 [Tepidibacillus sp.]
MEAIKAWQEKDSLVLSFPSKSNKLRHYLVKVQRHKDSILVQHQCPASINGKRCHHIQDAVNHFIKWRWWEPQLDNVKSTNNPIIKKSNWKEILVPGTEGDLIDQLMAGGKYESKHIA